MTSNEKSGFDHFQKGTGPFFFGDRRMALTTILLPGLMIYVLYTFMGNAPSAVNFLWRTPTGPQLW